MDRKMNKNQLAAVHNNNASNSSPKSHRSRKMDSSPSLFSWLDFEKTSVTGSISSERPNSQLSNFSAASDDEYMRNLRETLDSGNYSLEKVGSHNYHKIIVDLNNDLLSAKTENIQMKFKLDEVRASLEMEWTEKVRRLSNENRNILEDKIGLERELKQMKSQHHANNDFIDLRNKIELLESERAKDEMELFQSRNYIQDLQIKLETKEKAGINLKEQIVDLHSKNQELILKVKRLDSETATIRNEMDMLRKSEAWYKNELHECQNKKLKVQEDMMNVRNELQMERNKNNRLYTEFTQQLRNCEDIEAKAMREKESLMRKLENIQANLGATMDKNHLLNHVKDVSDRQELNQIIENLEDELSVLNHKAEQQDTIIKQMEQKNKSLISNEASLQAKLADSTVVATMHENKIKELEENLRLTQSQCESLSYQNLDVKAENDRLNLHFESMSNEKSKIDETVQKLRDDFEVIMTRFKKLTEELILKEKKISELNVLNTTLQTKLQEHESVLLNDMTTENQLLKTDIITNESRLKSLNDEVERYKRIITQREVELKDLRTKIELKIQEIELLNESNQVGRQEISHLSQQLQNLFIEIKNKNERISSLLRQNRDLEEKTKSNESFENEMNGKVNLLTNENHSLTQQIVCLMQQIDESVPVDAKKMGVDKSVEVDSVTSEIEILRADMEMLRMDYEDKLNRSESNSKVLVKKLKDQVMQTKMAEEIAKERTEMALSNAENEAKLELTANKATILESKCQNIEQELDVVQKELNNSIKLLKDNNYWKNDDILVSITGLIETLNGEKLINENTENKCKKLLIELQKKDVDMERFKVVPNTSRLFEVETQYLDLQNALKTKDAEISTLNHELQHLHDKIENLTSQHDALQLQLVTVSSQNVEISENNADLKNQLHSSGFEIQMLEEKCESYKNIERSVLQSKEQIVREMQILRKELSIEHDEKMELQKLTTELKFALSQVMDSAKEEAKSFTSMKRTDFSKTLKILEKSASIKTASLTPLQECVDSLKQEMNVLNKMIRQNSQIRTDITNEMSLMDELKLVADR